MGSILEIAPMVLRRCVTVMDVLEASTQLASVTVQQIHEACLAAVHDSAPKPDLAFSSACGRRSFLLQLSRVGDEQWVGNLEETTAQRLAEAQALQQALRDPLTGLCNRALFQERVNVAVSNSTESLLGYSVILVDLDRFKAVNDTLGHPIGDALLRLVAKRLLSVVRKHDVVARLGGDEFALLISPTLDLDALAVLARRLIDVLGRPYLVEGHLVNVGASIGIAVSPREGLQYEALMRNADLALYASKNGGRNIFSFFEPDMDSRAMARRTLEIDLRKALALREFELHYQPQVDLDSNAVVGFEALLRWRHPERGLVSPADFIPLAEEIGLIVPLGEWVMREACVSAMQWPDEVSVAVNVSPRQFEDCGRLVDMVAKALAASGLPGTRLEVEITESVLLGNEAGVLDALHRIRAMGVRVAMDDFGTGYSSLSQLSSFPFDKIKIDRSFVTNGDARGGHDAIIRAITALGVSLGMSTIAEGVETSDQLARIRTEGCTSVQGYLFSKPVPSAQVDALIADFASRRTVAALCIMKGIAS
ncbi:MAG: putative bifunctional diguanylate cyclase/phosphodiesterase [Janthinobacterium lividum]